MMRIYVDHTSRNATLRNGRPTAGCRRRRLAPGLEPLEERLVLSTWTVTSAADGGSGSLRAAVAAAGRGDAIVFASSLDGQAIPLTSGEIAIGQDPTIRGPRAGLLTVDAGGSSRIFDVTSATATVRISGLTISGDSAATSAGIPDQGGALTLSGDLLTGNQTVGVNAGDTARGGAVEVTDGGALHVATSVFQANLVQGAAGAAGGSDPVSNGQGGDGNGGAIYADAGTSVSISSSTFSGNRALGGAGGAGGDGQGGGLFVDLAATVALTGDSITGNQAVGSRFGMGTITDGSDGQGPGGGGFLSGSGSTAKRTTIAGNSASSGGNDVYGPFS